MTVTAAGQGAARAWRATFADFARLSWPIVLSRVGIQVMGLTDAVVVGHASTRQLAFHALGWAPTIVVLVAAVGLLNGVQVMAARRMGEGRPELAGGVLRDGCVYAGAIGLATTAALIAFGPGFLLALGLDPGLARGAGRALQVFALSLTPYLLATACASWLEGLGRPIPGLVAMWAANAVNLALNLWLVPGGFGVPALGAVGAGWATLGARSFLLLGLIVAILRQGDAEALGVFRPQRPGRAAAREQRRIGYGAGASYFAEAGAFSGMNVVAGWLGPLPVAAWALAINFSAIVFMLPLGFAGATAVLVGRAVGAGDPGGVRRAAAVGYGVSAVCALLIALAVWPAGRAIAAVYTSDPALVAAAGATLTLGALFFVPDALQAVAAQALRARGDVLKPTLIHVASYAGLMLPLGWALAHPARLGLAGCMWAVIVASVVAAGALLSRFYALAPRSDAQDPALLSLDLGDPLR
ncbi:MAG: MATE family efflux transporter [Caulobacteraceae bacterium]|nr:MATE family efflux transporter [Caulobacter sp.]